MGVWHRSVHPRQGPSPECSSNMCGICGIFEPGRETPIDCATLKSMADCMTHRGPDDEGFYSNPGIGLGFRRLSIIDLTSAGRQPI